MLWENFKDVISVLKKAERNKVLVQHNPQLEKLLVEFINAVRLELNPAAKPFCRPKEWTFTPLVIHATEIMHYREIMGLARLKSNEYFEDYLEFCKNKEFGQALLRNNLFVIHEHLIKLSHVIQAKSKTSEDLKSMQEMLIGLSKKINSIDSEKCGALFKAYLDAYIQYLLAMTLIQDPLAQRNQLLETFISARVAGKIENAPLHEKTMLQDPDILDFYTCGRNLLARIPLASFQQIQDKIASTANMGIQEINNCFNIANTRYNELLAVGLDNLTPPPASNRASI